MATFRDMFSSVAREYAASRPRYPAALFAHLASRSPSGMPAWDCATGSGQAATALTEHFAAVYATDASTAQLAESEEHARVHYAAALAESAPFPDHAFALVTVAQALHWLDIPRFFGEARRVLAPGGIIAVWCYALARIEPEIDVRLSDLYRETLGPYWAPERRLVEAGYRTIPFPFEELTSPPFEMSATMTLAGFASYVGTWSAVLRYRAAVGEDLVARLVDSIRDAWGPGEREVRWPLSVRIGRI